MKALTHAAVAGCLTAFALGAFAADPMNKPATKMTMADCKRLPQLEKKDGQKDDPELSNKHKVCAEMMGKSGTAADGAASAPMKK